MDDSKHKWFGFLEQVEQLNSVVELLEKSLPKLLLFQATLQEKLSQLDELKVFSNILIFFLKYCSFINFCILS